MTAAQGSRHVWPAAIVAGLAVVLTGTIAFNSVQAGSKRDDAALLKKNQDLALELRNMTKRLDALEGAITVWSQKCTPASPVDKTVSGQ